MGGGEVIPTLGVSAEQLSVWLDRAMRERDEARKLAEEWRDFAMLDYSWLKVNAKRDDVKLPDEDGTLPWEVEK
jgi:hypothetical protein